MDPDRWRRLNELFHGALERTPSERGAYVERACRDDQALRAEVLSLVEAHGQASVFEDTALSADPELRDLLRPTDLVGQQIGPYTITRVLGHGGMGVVYLGEDTRLGRPVAVKALHRSLTHHESYRARLRREAATAAALSHPGIATVFALEEIDGRPYIIREYVEGRTLREDLRSGPLPIPNLLAVAGDVARALAAAHAQGVIHRDIKPENVMRTVTGLTKVVDFGLARFDRVDDGRHERLTAGGSVLGTPGYMAPEQIRGDAVDFRADQFAFGVLLHELATGRHPFEGGDDAAVLARVLEGRPPTIATRRPGCPTGLDAVVARCLAKRPDDRYPKTSELVADLETLVERPPGVRLTAPEPPPPPGHTGTGPEQRLALWWWQFHQIAVTVIHGLTLYPIWHVRDWLPDQWGLVSFVAAVTAVGVSASLRLHLWFTSRVYPTELPTQRQRATPWQRSAEGVLALLLLASALGVGAAHVEWTALLVAVAITSLVSAVFVEPATTRAAFPSERRGARSRDNPPPSNWPPR